MVDRSLNYGRNIIEQFLKLALPYQTVLDLGGGCGSDLLLARKVNPDATLYAIEVHPEYIRKMAEKNITVYPRNIENDMFPFKNESIEVVIVNQVLEHAKEVFWILHEISRILIIGGKLIIGVPNLASLHNRLLLALGFQPTSIKTSSAHIRGFTKGDILNFFQNCFPGYQLKAFAGSNFYPFPPIIAIPLAKLFPTMAWGIFFLFEKKQRYTREFLDFPDTQGLETNFYTG